jgi:hypothetical protein
LHAFWRPSVPPPATIAEIAGSGAAQVKPALPLPDTPSIAVLPFDNLSGEVRYERLERHPDRRNRLGIHNVRLL